MSALRRYLPPLASGTLFGAGLVIGGMTDPGRVIGFLDIFGPWDPTLAFVMLGATAVTAIAWLLKRRMTAPAFAPSFVLPSRRDIDRSLVAGAAIFGIGWGIAGICPGPSLALIALAPAAIAPFILAMLAGMAGHRLFSSFTPSSEARR